MLFLQMAVIWWRLADRAGTRDGRRAAPAQSAGVSTLLLRRVRGPHCLAIVWRVIPLSQVVARPTLAGPRCAGELPVPGAVDTEAHGLDRAAIERLRAHFGPEATVVADFHDSAPAPCEASSRRVARTSSCCVATKTAAGRWRVVELEWSGKDAT